MLFDLYKNVYSGLSRNSWYLAIVMFVNRSGGMVLPFLTIYAIKMLHFSIVQSTMILACYGLGAIAGGLSGGKATDRFGFYNVQLFALLSGGIMFFVLSFQLTFFSIIPTVIILSFCNEAFRPANSTAIAFYSTPQNKTRSFSLNRLAINLGWAFGGALGGFLASFNYKFLFWADGITNLLAGLLLLKLLPPPTVKETRSTTIEKKHQRSPYKDHYYLFFIFLSILVASSFFQFFNMQALFFKSHWHLTEGFIGGLMALNGLMIAFVEMLLVHILEGRKNGLVYITFGTIMLAVGFLMICALPPGQTAAVAVVIVVTTGEMISMPFMDSFWMSRTKVENSGAYTGLYAITLSAGQVLSPTIGGLLISYFGFGCLWWSLGIVGLLASAGFWVLFMRRSKA